MFALDISRDEYLFSKLAFQTFCSPAIEKGEALIARRLFLNQEKFRLTRVLGSSLITGDERE